MSKKNAGDVNVNYIGEIDEIGNGLSKNDNDKNNSVKRQKEL